MKYILLIIVLFTIVTSQISMQASERDFPENSISMLFYDHLHPTMYGAYTYSLTRVNGIGMGYGISGYKLSSLRSSGSFFHTFSIPHTPNLAIHVTQALGYSEEQKSGYFENRVSIAPPLNQTGIKFGVIQQLNFSDSDWLDVFAFVGIQFDI